MKKKKRPIIAAGGVVARYTRNELLFAVCHRPEFEDWCLPKGKLKKNETIEECARREIREETGHFAELSRFIGHTEYRVGARQKFIYWWYAVADEFRARSPLAPDVDAVRWLPLAEARELVRKKDRPALDLISEILRNTKN